MQGSTGESEMGLKKLMDFTRLGSIVVLFIHFYFYCYSAFNHWELTAAFSDRLLLNLSKTGLFNSVLTSKGFCFLLLLISLIGAKGKKSENIQKKSIIIDLFLGVVLFFSSPLLLSFTGNIIAIALLYI